MSLEVTLNRKEISVEVNVEQRLASIEVNGVFGGTISSSNLTDSDTLVRNSQEYEIPVSSIVIISELEHDELMTNNETLDNRLYFRI